VRELEASVVGSSAEVSPVSEGTYLSCTIERFALPEFFASLECVLVPKTVE